MTFLYNHFDWIIFLALIAAFFFLFLQIILGHYFGKLGLNLALIIQFFLSLCLVLWGLHSADQLDPNANYYFGYEHYYRTKILLPAPILLVAFLLNTLTCGFIRRRYIKIRYEGEIL